MSDGNGKNFSVDKRTSRPYLYARRSPIPSIPPRVRCTPDLPFFLPTISAYLCNTYVLIIHSLSIHRFTKSQKRASLLLSDVSQSIFAALASPTPVQPSKRQEHQDVKSLLEEDDMDGRDEKGLGDVLVPSVLSPTPLSVSPATQTHKSTTTTDDDDDDWNW